jgi:ADP-ribose pyrophosphatase YjhB (NUDIX family)
LALHVDPRLDDPEIWILPGGGVEPGETPAQAARRELFEETVLVADLGPMVWIRRHTWRFGTRWVDQHDHIFLVRTTTFVPNPGLRNAEADLVRTWRWWASAELQAAVDQVFVPRRIGWLLQDLLAEVPAVPIEIGR